MCYMQRGVGLGSPSTPPSPNAHTPSSPIGRYDDTVVWGRRVYRHINWAITTKATRNNPNVTAACMRTHARAVLSLADCNVRLRFAYQAQSSTR